MSRPQPTQKQMIFQQVMLMIAVFLGLQLMCNRPQAGQTDPRSSDQILGSVETVAQQAPPTPKLGESWDMAKGSMYWADATLRWSTLSQIKTSLYDPRVKDEAEKAKKGLKDPAAIKAVDDEEKRKLLLGDILLADTQYKFGLDRNDTGALRNAFNTLQGRERELQGTPIWEEPVAVPASLSRPERFEWRSISGKDLYERIVAKLSEKNRTELTYGVFPGYSFIDWLVHLTGANPEYSYAFAAFLLALFVRAAIFPLAQKQLMWGRKMQQLAPLVKEIKEQFTDKKTKQVTDQAELQKRTMALYAEYGINPLAGCLPALVQFPLFITVYQFMLHYQFAFQAGHFLWINPSTSAATHGFFAPNLGFRDATLVVIYGITMVISTLLMPVSDPTQVKQQRIMGVGMGLLITVMMFTGAFPTPAAFVLYWVFTNLLATAQSLRAYRMPMPPLEKVNTKTGGVFPMSPFAPQTKVNGKPTAMIQTPASTGTPAKHKPKKRK